MLTLDQLLKIMPLARSRASAWLTPLNKAMAEFDINTPKRAASFLAQIAHESAELAKTIESFNHRVERLPEVFPKYFTAEKAKAYGRIDGVQPANMQGIANIVYGGRMGNTAAGDGWKFRGRGLIQVTGRENYTKCGAALGVHLLDQPELLELPDLACASAAWFWKTSGCNALADAGDQTAVTKRINGGTNGLADRLAYHAVAAKVLSC